MSEKITVKEKAVLRNEFYTSIENSLVNEGMTVEPVSEGMLIHLENGLFAEVKVTIKNEEKFDLEEARAKYAEKMARQAERAAKSAEVAKRKAEKAAEKLAKEQAKVETEA